MTFQTQTVSECDAMAGSRLRLITWLVTGAMFMEVLDGTIIATALPAMARSFGTTAVQLNIGISAYLLALGVFIPVSGWIADRFGVRKVFTLAIALFTLTSALCGLMNDLWHFVALRILQGASGALMVPVGRLLVLRYTPQDRLMAAMSSLVWPALIAPVIGPPLGGFITTHASWHWIFFLNVPLGIAALVTALVLVPDIRSERPRRFDLAGFMLCGSGTFSLLLGLDKLVEAVTFVSLAVTLAGVILLIASVRHFRRAETPMLDLTSFRIPTFRVALVGGSISRMAIGSAPFLLPLMFQIGFGFDAFRSGLLLLVIFAGNLGMKSVTTPILRRFGYKPVMVVNGILSALCLASCALLTADTPMAIFLAVLFVSGMTRSMQFTALGTVAFADVPKSQMSDANGLFNTISQITMAAGITLGAMGVHAGGAFSHLFPYGDGANDFRVAFLLTSVVALAGVLDTIRLPSGAGDHFISRR